MKLTQLFAISSALSIAAMSCGASGEGASGMTGGRPGRNPAGAQAAGTISLALKNVVFENANNQPVVSRETLDGVVNQINAFYEGCGIRFIPEDYQAVKPEQYGLPSEIGVTSLMSEIRTKFDDPRYLVVVTTGEWNHGTMGSANAWTAMPNSPPYGVVLEAPVATFAPIVAHEIGHYLGLDHIGDTSNLMNPMIYPSSTSLSASQCQAMREIANSHWAMAQRG